MMPVDREHRSRPLANRVVLIFFSARREPRAAVDRPTSDAVG